MFSSRGTSAAQRLARFSQSLVRQSSTAPEIAITLRSGRSVVQVLEAIGTDLRISCPIQPGFGERTVVTISRGTQPELAIPGIIHWLDLRTSPIEAGIALQEPLPAELEVRQPGCTRANIRFSCRTEGQLRWVAETAAEVSATAVNYSREGCCLQVRTAPEIGARAEFHWNTLAGAHCLKGDVRWAIGQNGGFLIGIEFPDRSGYAISGIS